MNHKRVYQIFYSKDIRKKKKVYSQGVLVCQDRKTKLFTSEGECVLSLNNKSSPMPDEQYTINNTYVVLIQKEVPFEEYERGIVFLPKKMSGLSLVKKPVKKKQSLQKLTYDFARQFKNGLKVETFIYPYLREHQVQGVNFMYQCLTGQKQSRIQGCILADFMGLGKTLQTLTLIRCLLINKIVTKVLVMCPLTLIKVWEKQCSKWMGSKLNPLVAFGSPDEIAKIIRMFTDYEYRFLVASYEQFYKYSDSLKCDLMIFDEGHRLKNKKSKLFKKLHFFKCKRRVLLTGTPIQNNLDQLYTCITLVNPSFFQSESIFKNVFQKPIIAGMAKCASKELRSLALSRTAELANLIKSFSLRRKANVLEGYLPKKRQYQIFLKLSPLQTILYQRILKKKINDTEVLSYLNQMRKLFTHPLLFKADRFDNLQWNDCSEDCQEEKSTKMEFVKQVALYCKQHSEKLVIVSYFTQTLDFIQQMLNQHEITSSKLDGRLEGQQRFIAVQNFIKYNTVLLLSGKAGGTGLTLTCASKMIMIEPDWNPSNDSQVMGRVWRQGQQKEVQIFRLLIGCTFQEKILQRQQLKQSLSQKLIDEQTTSNSYDFFSMKQLFMEIAPKCITYPPTDNKVELCKQGITYVSWQQCVFVKIIESHTSQKLHMENEFQHAQFDQVDAQNESKQQKEEVDQDLQEDLEFIQLREQQQISQIPHQKFDLPTIFDESRDPDHNHYPLAETKFTEQQASTRQMIQSHQEFPEKPHLNEPTADFTLTPALRKIKRKVSKLEDE